MKRTPFKRSRKPFPKKPRKRSLAGLKRTLWSFYSPYIRKKDADENGMVKCISCPIIKHWSEMDCGHYLPKSLGLSVYFLEKNTAAQCQKCNLFLQGNQYQYALALQARYGQGILDELDAARREIKKYSREEYMELILKYQGLLDSLAAKP